jgi:hypothetical protein
MKVPKKGRKPQPKRAKSVAAKPAAGEKRTLLPVLRPYFNGREVIKQLAMLEDHLNNQTKRCTDCIHKHFLTSEGLAEELGSLCTDPANRECGDLPSKIRVLHHAWAESPTEAVTLTVAQELRAIRKALMRRYATLPLDKLPSDETRQVKALVARCRGIMKKKCGKPTRGKPTGGKAAGKKASKKKTSA